MSISCLETSFQNFSRRKTSLRKIMLHCLLAAFSEPFWFLYLNVFVSTAQNWWRKSSYKFESQEYHICFWSKNIIEEEYCENISCPGILKTEKTIYIEHCSTVMILIHQALELVRVTRICLMITLGILHNPRKKKSRIRTSFLDSSNMATNGIFELFFSDMIMEQLMHLKVNMLRVVDIVYSWILADFWMRMQKEMQSIHEWIISDFGETSPLYCKQYMRWSSLLVSLACAVLFVIRKGMVSGLLLHIWHKLSSTFF